MKPGDLARVIVDTTVQPKNVTFPTDAKLLNRAREKLVKHRATPILHAGRQVRTHPASAIRPCPPVQPCQQGLRKLKTYLGRVIRDITRKIEGDPWLETKFAWLLNLARRSGARTARSQSLQPARPRGGVHQPL